MNSRGKDQEEKKWKGARCHVCTGCGRCFGVDDFESGIQILMGRAEEQTQPVSSKNGERLVTADIGTTTVAMELYGTDGTAEDQFAAVNPQTGYGADVLSRIQAAENPAAADKMREMARDVLGRGISRFQERLKEGESLRMVLAANTTMVYLLMGWDTAELGKAPFLASHLEAVETDIAGVPTYIMQGLSAFVGGDIVAGILSCGMTEREEITLLIDLGTNAEMALGNRKRLIACSAAAGPAFEGGVNRGVWGADMIRILARLRREGIVDGTGLLADPFFETGVRIGDVCVTQKSVRAIQLAKGAIAAGIKILAKRYGISLNQIDRVVLAGGFGYRLDPRCAVEIGLLPPELGRKTVPGGNTALAGALRLGRSLFGEGEPVHKEPLSAETLNLAEIPEFQELYIESMGLQEQREDC